MERMILGFILAVMPAFAMADMPRTHETVLHVGDVFIPTEKNLSGDSYVVVSGMFPSSCYRWSRAEVNHSSDTTHQIRLIATVTEGMCLTVMVPYTKEVIIGKLQSGDHTLRFLNGDDTYFERTMTVK